MQVLTTMPVLALMVKHLSIRPFPGSDEDHKALNALPSFLHFQEQLKASGLEVPPKQELLNLVGSTTDIFKA